MKKEDLKDIAEYHVSWLNDGNYGTCLPIPIQSYPSIDKKERMEVEILRDGLIVILWQSFKKFEFYVLNFEGVILCSYEDKNRTGIKMFCEFQDVKDVFKATLKPLF